MKTIGEIIALIAAIVSSFFFFSWIVTIIIGFIIIFIVGWLFGVQITICNKSYRWFSRVK